MASKNFSDWETPVGYYIKGANTSNDIVPAVRSVIRDFCEWTLLWTYPIQAVSTVIDQAEYSFTDLETDGKNVVVSIMSAKYKENGAANSQFYDLGVAEYDQFEETHAASWVYETAPLPRKVMFNHLENKFRLYPIPSVASTGGFIARVAVKPDTTATKCPDFFYNDYQEAITRGVSAYLMGQTNKPWANKQMSKIYWAEYIDKRYNASFDKKHGRTNRRIHVRPRLPFLPGSKRKFRAVASS